LIVIRYFLNPCNHSFKCCIRIYIATYIIRTSTDYFFLYSWSLNVLPCDFFFPDMKLSCSICKKIFTHSKTLKLHMRLHNASKGYECSICHKRFTRTWHCVTYMYLTVIYLYYWFIWNGLCYMDVLNKFNFG
jgi:hypothetical protein